ncbi:MAG TPA: crossover junction endodeoxyribonuclease RuvC [Balneolaceae bacterium]|nr:crossover junction endodeoxyribonuclease RuvC [Balneolaceae bacterium]
MPKRILGIDPGSRATGYAIIEQHNTSYNVIECSVLRMHKMDTHTERLQFIFDEISALIREYHPDECAIETPVYGVDPLAMLKLGRAQAAAILAITNEKLPVAEYYPKAVKKAIAGNGNASKQQVAFMLHKVLQIDTDGLTGDATDALAVAWCHITNRGVPSGSATGKKMHQNNSKSSWAKFVEENPDRIKES